MSTYKTVSGDTWDTIAYKLWSKEQYAGKLVDANPKYISTVVFSAGVELQVPDITVPVSTSLPPWKNGV